MQGVGGKEGDIGLQIVRAEARGNPLGERRSALRSEEAGGGKESKRVVAKRTTLMIASARLLQQIDGAPAVLRSAKARDTLDLLSEAIMIQFLAGTDDALAHV